MQVQLQKEEKQEDIMENRSCIQQSLDKIEAELASEISVNELAKKAGYSLFYYIPERSRNASHAVYYKTTSLTWNL